MKMFGPEQKFYCKQVCQDKKRYDLKFYDARRINYTLDRIIASKNIKKVDRSRLNPLHFRNVNHFMCGYCNEVNVQELNNLEFDMLLKCEAIKSYIESDFNDEKRKLKYTVLGLLQGHYPKLYEWFKR